MKRADIFAAIDAERLRQGEKWNKPHAWGIGDCSSSAVGSSVKLMVLTEEVGEVARAVLDQHSIDALRRELVEVAAVAVAWAEAL